MKRQLIFLITLVMVTAVIFAIPPLLRALNAAPLTLSSQPDFVVTSEQAAAPNPNTTEVITLLTVTEKENSADLQARPVDPMTLLDLPGFAPIDFGRHYTYAISPDHRKLAVITWPRDSDVGGELHLIDLDTWIVTPTDLQTDVYVGEVTFSADGKTLFWVAPTVYDPAHGMPRDYRLYRYDLHSRQWSVIIQFQSSFIPWSQHLSSGRLAIVGVPTDSNNLAGDVPHLLIIDPTENRTVADVRLDGVKAGQFHEEVTNETASGQGETWHYVSYSPGLAWDSDRKMLYVAHADSSKVTKVDLADGSVMEHVQIRPRQPFLEWISESLAPTAQAKGGSWLGARVILSPKGERLYVFSEETWMDLPRTTGLRLIATEGMREIGHIDELLTDFALTPDGKSLLVIKGEIDRSYGFDMLVNRNVYILDAETLRERIHLRIDRADQLWFDGFSPDGRYAYLRGSSAEWVEESGWRNWRTTWQLLDLNSYRLISARESESMYGVLLHVAP